MIKLIFKDVGQGDSILLEWGESGDHVGIIDCNLRGSENPILDEIRKRKIKKIDFIVVSHLHVDHFSGFPDLFEYCNEHNISIGKFYITFTTEFLKIFSDILQSQNNQRLGERFFSLFKKLSDRNIIREIETVSPSLEPYALSGGYVMKFLSPIGKDLLEFSSQQARYLQKETTTLPDVNTLSSVIKITDTETAALITGDTTFKQLKRLVGKVTETLVCAQVPHHGSANNHNPKFWESVAREDQCPAIFSVGDLKRDKLPKVEVVRYFDQNGYLVEATNCVYGIAEHFKIKQPEISATARKTIAALTPFSSLKSPSMKGSLTIPSRFTGDREISLE